MYGARALCYNNCSAILYGNSECVDGSSAMARGMILLRSVYRRGIALDYYIVYNNEELLRNSGDEN